jgi:hypothetical protein
MKLNLLKKSCSETRFLRGMQGMFSKKKGEHLLNGSIWKFFSEIRISLVVVNIYHCPKHSTSSLKNKKSYGKHQSSAPAKQKTIDQPTLIISIHFSYLRKNQNSNITYLIMTFL